MMAHAFNSSASGLGQTQCRRDVKCGAQKVKSGKQVVCSKTLVAKPGHGESVAKLVAGVTSYSLEAAKTRTNGIVVFEAVRDAWDSNTFHTWERYDSNVSLGKHNTSIAYKTFLSQVHPHLQEPVGMALYEWKDGRLGPAALAEGPKGEGGLDDATGASGAAGGASMKQTSAAFNIVGIHNVGESDKISDRLTEGLTAAKKQMDGLKDLFGNMFGKKDTPPKIKATQEKRETAGKK